ncbi:MAG: nickel-dependent hydrogenase large subunit [Sulfurovaceae bacterium]|nr:nickel-dependent hydrogenase large subunit [Sulfurovaceae bacterium]MDD5548185.1 nickel-dependent hydrogenase large subunit [Sulfurovaceae bacterium]
MKIKHFVEKVEGETELEFDFKNGIVNNVNIIFPFYRGIEEILKSRDALDALVITPRVCGICNHAHLIASTRAIENGLIDAGVNIHLTPKAISLREFTLCCEIIQSHFKWFYLVAMPQLANLNKLTISDNHILKASWVSINTVKALAIFAGQWPHSGYVVPGGVSCDPTYEEIIQAEALIDDIIRFTQQEFLGISIDEYYKTKEISNINGDMIEILNMLNNQNMQEKGKSYNRFLALGKHLVFKDGQYDQNIYGTAKIEYIKEHIQTGSKAKSVAYENKCYEVGPLARAILEKNDFIMDMHSKYQDSALTRVCARMDEIVKLLIYTKKLLANLNVKELSCTLPKFPKDLEANGTGIVEAARGSLIHQSIIKGGKIQNYNIITPTQWNLSNGIEKTSGIATKAMKGSINTEEATFIFRTFDVCSVCTTH